MRLSSCSDHTVNTSHPPTGHPTAIWRKGTFPARVIKNLQIIVHYLALAPSHAVCPLRRSTHAHGGWLQDLAHAPQGAGAGLLSVLKRPRASRTQPQGGGHVATLAQPWRGLLPANDRGWSARDCNAHAIHQQGCLTCFDAMAWGCPLVISVRNCCPDCSAAMA